MMGFLRFTGWTPIPLWTPAALSGLEPSSLSAPELMGPVLVGEERGQCVCSTELHTVKTREVLRGPRYAPCRTPAT